MMLKPLVLFLSCTAALTAQPDLARAEGEAAVAVDPALTQPLAANLSGPPDCARLAAAAGVAEGLPEGLLPAISLVESGKGDGEGGRMPWPWTLNQGGKSHYLDSKAEALAKLDEILATGTTNVDVGCMQLNWKWHSASFASREDMLDPVQNTAYAARFLKELKNQLGTWELATAAYHSTDPDRGQSYLAKVSAAQETMIARLPTLDEGQQPSVLLSAVPMRLQGLLALAGSPMFTQAAERAALIGAQTVAAAAEAVANPPAFAPGEDDPDLPLVEEPSALTAKPGQKRPAAPDLPMVVAATESDQMRFDTAPRRLRERWTDVEKMRRILLANR